MRNLRPHLESPVSFVDYKGNKQWVWLALDAGTRLSGDYLQTEEIVAVYIGKRDETAARQLWESLPPVYRGAGDAPPPVNARSPTLIFGQHIGQSYQANAIKRLGKKQAKLVTLNLRPTSNAFEVECGGHSADSTTH